MNVSLSIKVMDFFITSFWHQLSAHSGASARNGSEVVGGGQEVIHGSQVVAVGTPLPTASLPLGAQQGPVMVGAHYSSNTTPSLIGGSSWCSG